MIIIRVIIDSNMSSSPLFESLSKITKNITTNNAYSTRESYKIKSSKKKYDFIDIESVNKFCQDIYKFKTYYEVSASKNEHLVKIHKEYIIKFYDMDLLILYVKKLI